MITDRIRQRRAALREAAARICEHVVPVDRDGTEGARAQTVVVTAREPREGVTTVVVALAGYLARVRGLRVAAIDVTGRGEQGLRHLLDGGETVPGNEPAPGIEVVSWSAPEDGHGDGSPQATIERLEHSTDVIIVDAGSLRATVALQWARFAGTRLLVVDGNRTTAEALHRLGEELRRAGIEISGVVLNKRRYWVPQVLYRHLY